MKFPGKYKGKKIYQYLLEAILRGKANLNGAEVDREEFLCDFPTMYGMQTCKMFINYTQ